MDNEPHDLIDAETGRVISRTTKRFLGAPGFSDFDDWLRLSMVYPQIHAPFGEPAKRVFATMECVRRFLCTEALKSKANDLVTIVMPAFNRAEMIRPAIESVLAQAYRNFELIVVNDGSTDGTVDVVRSFDDPRIRLINLAENGGAAAARNAALDASQGRIITYLDTDNTVTEDFLLAVVGAFSMLPEADAIYCAQAIFDGSGTTPRMIRFGALNRSLLRNRNYIDLGAFAHRSTPNSSGPRIGI